MLERHRKDNGICTSLRLLSKIHTILPISGSVSHTSNTIFAYIDQKHMVNE